MTRSPSTTARLAALAGLGTLVASTLVAAPAEAGRPADRPWSGFRIAQDQQAATPWVGARKANRRVVYRIDPRAARDAGPRFGPVRKVSKVSGPRRKSTAGSVATSRAAYILSKYGSLRQDVQSAGVDAAVLHLVAGGAYRHNRQAGNKRILRTGEARAVKAMVRSLLRESARHAGPYVVSSTQRGTAIPGGEAQVLIEVASERTGAPLEGAAVTIKDAGRTINAGTTDDHGSVQATIPTPEEGTDSFDISVGRVPETRLLLRKPARRSASRVAIAGVKRSIAGRGSVEVTAGSPQVRVAVPSTRVKLGRSPGGTFTVTGSAGDQERRVRVERFGPSDTGSSVRCQKGGGNTPSYKSADLSITSNGTYSLPRWRVREEGYYLYSVTVGPNDANPEASVCGAKVHAVAG